MVYAQDVALMSRKDSVVVKCGFSLGQLPVDAVNPELKSGAENGLDENEKNNFSALSFVQHKESVKRKSGH